MQSLTVAVFLTCITAALGQTSLPAGINRASSSGATISAFDTIPITATPFVDALSNDQYVIDVFTLPNTTVQGGGVLIPLGASSFPPLAGQGQSLVRLVLQPCALLDVHNHPRASELLVVLSGSLTVGHTSEDNSNSWVSNVTQFQYTVFPAGTGHFYLNTFCQQTIFDILFNNGNPGTQFYRAAYANFGANIRNITGTPGTFNAPIIPNADPACVAKCKGATAPAAGYTTG